MEPKVCSQTDVAVRPSLCRAQVRSVHLHTNSVLTVGPLEKSNRPSISPPVPPSAAAARLMPFCWGAETMLEAPELLFPSGETRPLCLANTAARFMLGAAGWPAPVSDNSPLSPKTSGVTAGKSRTPSRFLAACFGENESACGGVFTPHWTLLYPESQILHAFIYCVNGGEQTRRNTGRKPTLASGILTSFPYSLPFALMLLSSFQSSNFDKWKLKTSSTYNI